MTSESTKKDMIIAAQLFFTNSQLCWFVYLTDAHPSSNQQFLLRAIQDNTRHEPVEKCTYIAILLVDITGAIIKNLTNRSCYWPVSSGNFSNFTITKSYFVMI